MAIRVTTNPDHISSNTNMLDYNAPFTVIADIYIAVDTNADATIFNLFGTSSNYDYIGLDSNGTTLIAYTNIGGSFQGVSGTNLNVGQYYKIAFRRTSATNLEVSLDGILDIVNAQDMTGRSAITDMRIGYWDNSFPTQFNGRFCNYKAWNIALTPQEIAIEQTRIRPITKLGNLNRFSPFMSGAVERLRDYGPLNTPWTPSGTLISEPRSSTPWGDSAIVLPFVPTVGGGGAIISSLDAYLQKQIAITASADAQIQKTLSLTAQADAYLQKAFNLISNADAQLQIQGIIRTVNTDAVLQKVLSLVASADAILGIAGTSVFSSSDAQLQKLLSLVASADAILKKVFTIQSSADAQIQKTLMAQASTDALLQKQFAITANTDAWLSKLRQVTASADAILGGVTGIFSSTDALLQKLGLTLSTSADAVLGKLSFIATEGSLSLIDIIGQGTQSLITVVGIGTNSLIRSSEGTHSLFRTDGMGTNSLIDPTGQGSNSGL